MDWGVEAVMALRALIAALFDAFIDCEHERHGREAGIRNYAAVSLSAAVFGLVSSRMVGAPTRPASPRAS